MCSIEREKQNFILKFREIFLKREIVLRAHRKKPDEKPFWFFGQIYYYYYFFFSESRSLKN